MKLFWTSYILAAIFCILTVVYSHLKHRSSQSYTDTSVFWVIVGCIIGLIPVLNFILSGKIVHSILTDD